MEAGIWKEKLREAGAIAVGICETGRVPEEHLESLRSWHETGMNAWMGYMENHQELRADPRGLLEGAQSIISIAFPYTQSERPASLPQIASYAFGEDYHDWIRRRLGKVVEELKERYGGEYRICIDSAPIFERYWAERSGVGRRCDNGLIAVRGYGTRVLLAEILTTLEIESGAFTQDEDSGDKREILAETDADICLHCGACRRACPAGALQGDSRVDARRCLSYLTIEHRGEWDQTGMEAMRTPVGRNTLFGCDICQNVCPLNRVPLKWMESNGVLAGEDARINPELLSRLNTITAAEVEVMTQEDFSRLFKGSAIKRTKLSGLKRNAGNRG